jgi:autotransporter translocation and assembly factor TamB
MSVLRGLARVLLFVTVLAVGLVSVGIVVSQTPWFRDWLRGVIERQAGEYLRGELTIGRLDGNLFAGVALEDVAVTMDGEAVVSVGRIGLAYDALTLVRGEVVLDELRLEAPTIRATWTDEGLNLGRLVELPTPDPEAPPRERPIVIRRFEVVDGTVHVAGDVPVQGVDVPRRFDAVQVALGLSSGPDELRLDIDHVSMQARTPDLDLEAFSGLLRRTEHAWRLDGVRVRTVASRVAVDGEIGQLAAAVPTLDLRAEGGVDLQEIGAVVPVLRAYPLTPAFTVTASGPADQLALALHLEEPRAGVVDGDLTVDVAGPGRRVSGSVDVARLDLAIALQRPALESAMTGRARIDLALPVDGRPLSGTWSVTAPAVRVAGYEVTDLSADGRVDGDRVAFDGVGTAYGARTTATGAVVVREPLHLDVRGRTAGIDLRSLPAGLNLPRVASRLEADYRVEVRGPVVTGDARFASSSLAGAIIEPGTEAEFRVGDGAPRYAARGGVRALDLQQVGTAFGIDALADERFRSTLHGRFEMSGEGGGRDPLVLEASAALADSELSGTRLPQADVAARVAGEDLQVEVTGTFAGLDPARLTGDDRHAGNVSGAIDVEGTIEGYRAGVRLDEVVANGRVSLEPSTVGRIAIQSAELDAVYDRGLAEIGSLTVSGRDLTMDAEGRVALTQDGRSDLVVHLETPSLDEIGELIGRPLQGGVILDAVVTGTSRELTIEGDLQGSRMAWGDTEALSVTSEFRITLPDLTLEDATVVADSRATFVEVAGLAITELAADVTFREPGLEFAFVAREGVRELTAGGSAVFHPERQEVRLTELGMRAEEVWWTIAEGSEALIDYGGDRIAVEGLRLVSVDDQRIDVEGVFGEPGESMRIAVEGVDVAELDRLVLGDERVRGRLSGEARLSGTREEPRVEAAFTLAPGGFADFDFDSFEGAAEYAGPGVTLDVRLEQTPGHWISVQGYAPGSLFRPTPADAPRPAAPPPGELVDLTVASSEIELGVVQGFTSAVTEVEGVLQANVRVTGTGDDPILEGAMDITGGAVTVPALGTRYTGIETRLDLRDDRIAIQEMRILDEAGNALTLGGEIAVQARALGAFDVSASGRRFQVLDNEFGQLDLDVDLQLTGELRAPRVIGLIEVAEGTIDVAAVVERVTTSPYRLAPDPADARAPSPVAIPALDPAGPDALAEVPPDPSADPRPDTAPDVRADADPDADAEPRVYDALDLNVGVAVPSNLLLRGTGIRPAGAPVAVGDMNVTVGGVLQVRKPPGAPLHLNGEVNTVRGHYTFQGRRFDILRDGRIRFVGGDEIDPLLDIRARREIAGVETIIRVQGTMRQPELAFTSTPPLDEADILSLIVFNTPLNELGEGQQIALAERAGALAGGYLAAGLTRSIGRVIGLDEFEIQARGEFGTAPRLIIGERIGNDLFVRIEHGFGADQATEFSLEYQIAEFLRLTGSVAETPGGAPRVQLRRVERAGIDLTFFFSF